MILMTLFACAASTPFEGPGVSDDGALRTDHAGPFVVAVTHAKPAKGKGGAFNDHVDAIEAQLLEMDGFVGYSFRGEIGGRDRWTLTLWESEDALMGFITTGVHIEAMAQSGELLEEIHSGVWVEEDPGQLPPTWGEALDFLDEQG